MFIFYANKTIYKLDMNLYLKKSMNSKDIHEVIE